VWDTAKDNVAAQALYERLGAERSEEWVDYSLPV
jgi:ribosomal protein S18 acetylase RimI-like enzyme